MLPNVWKHRRYDEAIGRWYWPCTVRTLRTLTASSTFSMTLRSQLAPCLPQRRRRLFPQTTLHPTRQQEKALGTTPCSLA